MYFQQFEGDAYILHLLIYGILTKCVAIILVKANHLFNCTWDFNPEFYSTILNKLIFQASNQEITLQQSMFDPPLEYWLCCKTIIN